MPNKKISEFPVTTTLAGSSNFLLNHLGTTSTVAFSSLSAAVTNDSIKLPSGATGGQVLTYNGSTSTWVASAAQNFTGSNQSLTSNGYQKLPGGIIIQWGVTDLINQGTNVQKTVTFPIPFPNSCFNVTSTLSGNLYGNTDGLGTIRVQVIAIISINNNSVILEHNGLNEVRAYWMAIGN